MTPVAEMASRFDTRSGYRLIDFEEVGLPIYKLTTVLLTLQKKEFPAVEEFILRAIELGLSTSEEISGFLGIDVRVTEKCLSKLIQEDHVFILKDRSVALSIRCAALLRGEAYIRPKEQALTWHFDGLTRKPIYAKGLSLLSPGDLKRLDVKEMRAFPNRKPEPHEIDIQLLEKAIGRENESEKTPIKLLRVREVGRRVHLFQSAIMLIFKQINGGEVRVSFVIDGRLSEEHEKAFLEAGGPTRSGIEASVLNAPKQETLRQSVGEVVADAVEAVVGGGIDTESLRTRMAIAKFRASMTRRAVEQATEEEKRGIEETRLKEAEKETSNILANISHIKVRPVPVYEHASLLIDALSTCQERLLILSPWITRAVVDNNFQRAIWGALDRGVKIFIGHGLDERNGGKLEPSLPERELATIAAKNTNFLIRRFGDTHAKVLLKDREYFVVSSFNWLSFRGDPKRTFREEWGTYVGVPEIVDQYFDRLVGRFMES